MVGTTVNPDAAAFLKRIEEAENQANEYASSGHDWSSGGADFTFSPFRASTTNPDRLDIEFECDSGMMNLDFTHARDNAMIAPNDQPQVPKPSVGPVEPTSMCVNMVYDPGPINQGEMSAARMFIDSVGGLERAKEVLRHMHTPIDAAPPQ